MRLLALFAIAIAALLLFGCTAAQREAAAASCSPLAGSDRDSHGCIGSAGYVWCDASQKCIRPWEENCTSELVGSDRDEHGCIGSAGYAWCAEKSKCLRVWEDDCPSLKEKAFMEQAKSYCSDSTSVSTCGQYIKVVSSMPGAGTSFYTLGNYDPTRCPLVSPEYISEQCRLLLFGNNCIDVPVQCQPAPKAITDLADDPNFVGAQLGWSRPDSTAVTYAIYRSDESSNTTSLVKMVSQTSYNDVFEGNGKTYKYFVRALNSEGLMSADSNYVYVKQLDNTKQPSPGQID